MKKTIDFDNLNEDINSSSDSEIELKQTKSGKEPIYKMKKERVPYVFTDARKAAFEKAREVRELNREERKTKKELDIEMKQKELDEKIVKKADVIKKRASKKEKMLEVEPEDDISEPEIIIKKVRKSKKKIIIVESDSDDDEIVVHKRKVKIRTPKPPVERPQQIIRKYVPVYH